MDIKNKFSNLEKFLSTNLKTDIYSKYTRTLKPIKKMKPKTETQEKKKKKNHFNYDIVFRTT